jgi:hypothetical protein
MLAVAAPASVNRPVALGHGPDVFGNAAPLLVFQQIWIVDFEFVASPGAQQQPVCCVAHELRSGRTLRLWSDDLYSMAAAPWNTGPLAVTVAYFASAEFGCFRTLGWPDPVNVIDLFAEFRSETNGLSLPAGRGLIGALAYFGLSTMTWGEKESMRELISSGGPWTREEQNAILDYCEEDVVATTKLFEVMSRALCLNSRRIGHAILRGRYMCAVAAMEHIGIPIDGKTFYQITARWRDIQDALIRDVDRDFGVFEGRSFKADRFAEWLTKARLRWPRLESGALALDDDTFCSMARAYPVVSPLRELRHALGEMRLNDISVGADGRNRTLISPFQSRTGRNQPSNSRFIFGAAVWLRGLIKPGQGMAIAYLDFSSQEIAIAAALSGDVALWRAYESGDPYIQFAIDAGLARAGATKTTHGAIRAKCKTVVLGTQYGMSAHGVAAAAGMTVAEARQLLILHRETYRVFWKWAEANVDRGLLGGVLTTPFGWQYRLDKDKSPNPRSLLNWPMQAGGADMLRLACTRIVKGGIRLCAPVHDAILIEAPVELIGSHVEDARSAMVWASTMVLGGRSCRVEADVYAYPDRYMDAERGARMWNRVMKLVGGPIWIEKPPLASPA